MTIPVRPHPTLTEYYVSDDERLTYLRALFNETAGHYDQANRLFSFGTGAWYRRRALQRAGLQRGMRMLDVAVGTGLMAAAARHVVKGNVDIIGLDPSEQMLREARRKLPIALIQGRAEALPFVDGGVDFISMGYALRHVSDLAVTFAEFSRVLRPGGRLLILEIGRPNGRIARALAATYLARVIPCLSQCLKPRSGLPKLMRYHWDTIEHCVPADVILKQLSNCGFAEVGCDTDLCMFRAYRALKPVDPTCSQSGETCCLCRNPAVEAEVPARSVATSHRCGNQ